MSSKSPRAEPLRHVQVASDVKRALLTSYAAVGAVALFRRTHLYAEHFVALRSPKPAPTMTATMTTTLTSSTMLAQILTHFRLICTVAFIGYV